MESILSFTESDGKINGILATETKAVLIPIAALKKLDQRFRNVAVSVLGTRGRCKVAGDKSALAPQYYVRVKRQSNYTGRAYKAIHFLVILTRATLFFDLLI